MPKPRSSSPDERTPLGRPAKRPASRKLPQQVRIIGGLWKRTRLPVADSPGLRPTPDRVRETLFNWLASIAGAGGGELPGWHCIDVFAGTGALGFEAASRGAAAVLLCESDTALVAQLNTVREKLEAGAVRVERGHGVAALERAVPASQHAIFIDPPFDQPALCESALKAAVRVLRPDGVVYLEAPRRWSDAEFAALGYAGYRHLKAGAVHAHLLSLPA